MTAPTQPGAAVRSTEREPADAQVPTEDVHTWSGKRMRVLHMLLDLWGQK